ncbi:MAG: sulfotransferase [Myxococcota bacterium]|nr:sulfotransferase [Myxococcota bacterium]
MRANEKAWGQATESAEGRATGIFMAEQTQQVRYPDFLVIGAMKSGTTTLAFDLDTHPEVGFPGGKEVGDLRRAEVLSEEGRAHYGRIFAGTPTHIKVGDAHPAYSYDLGLDVPGKARELCGSDVRLIYIMRDPIRRAISHHTHLFQRGGSTADADNDLRTDDLYVDFGLYAKQLECWLETFERSNFLFLRFEDYVRDRKQGYQSAVRHLGLEPRLEFLTEDVLNQAENKRLPAFNNRMDQRQLQQWRARLKNSLPAPLLSVARKMLTRPAPPPPDLPVESTLRYLYDRYSPELERLKELLGPDAPHWDLDETIDSLLDRSS